MQRMVAIKGQHWSIRGLLSAFSSIPLFNNYSSLLSGFVIRQNQPKISAINDSIKNYFRKKVYVNCLSLSLSTEMMYSMKEISYATGRNLQVKLNEYETFLIFKIYKKFPFMVRKFLNPKIRKFLNVI